MAAFKRGETSPGVVDQVGHVKLYHCDFVKLNYCRLETLLVVLNCVIATRDTVIVDQVGYFRLYILSTRLVMILSLSLSFPTYLIFVIFFTLAKFLENKIYTEKRQFFALNL